MPKIEEKNNRLQLSVLQTTPREEGYYKNGAHRTPRVILDAVGDNPLRSAGKQVSKPISDDWWEAVHPTAGQRHVDDAMHRHSRALAGRFKDSDANVRLDALSTLGTKGKSAHPYVSQMAMLLEDVDARVRLAAVVALGRMGEAAHLHASELAGRLDDTSEDVRQAVALALGRMGKAGADVLAVQLRHGDARVRLSAAEALGQMGEVAEKHTFNVAARLADSDPLSRMAAAEALGRMRELAHPYAGALAGRLEDEDPYVRMIASEALARLGEVGARALATRLSHEDPMVRRSTVYALGKMADSANPHISAIGNRLEDSDMRVQLTAYEALMQLDEGVNHGSNGFTTSWTSRRLEGHEVDTTHACTRRSDATLATAWSSSPRVRRVGANMQGRTLWKDLKRDQHATATRLLGSSILFRTRQKRRNGETELELLGLADSKVASDAAMQRATELADRKSVV